MVKETHMTSIKRPISVVYWETSDRFIVTTRCKFLFRYNRYGGIGVWDILNPSWGEYRDLKRFIFNFSYYGHGIARAVQIVRKMDARCGNPQEEFRLVKAGSMIKA